MSLYERLRESTDFDTLALCDKLVRLSDIYVCNEKHVPKRKRFVYATKLLEYAEKIREYVTVANHIRADSDELLEKRRSYQNNALAYCDLYQCKLIDMEEALDGVTAENLREIVDTLDSLVNHIKKWSKSDKAMTC